jgi:hypothetical protein
VLGTFSARSYFGVAFERVYIGERRQATGSFGSLLDDAEHGYPLLRQRGDHKRRATIERGCKPLLSPGRVYRTRDLEAWSVSAPRLAKRLVSEDELVPLGHGLFAHPKRGRFGVVPPSDDAILRAFLDDTPFVLTGPDRWNALGLGSTAVFAMPLVYNTKRSGVFELGGRKFMLRRVAFPEAAPAEWFVVDLIEHADQVGASRSDLTKSLARALASGRFDRARLRAMADRYARRATRALIESAMTLR